MTISQDFVNALPWRNIGPTRGGRVVAVAGDPVNRATFWFGACTGGVWMTDDGGTYWHNVSDGFFNTASIGAIAVAPSDRNVIWVGTGEGCVRNNVSAGDGVYRSVDGGATWRHLGLEATKHITRLRVDPRDPDVAYVAALGDIFGPNPERGVYRTRDGGATWELVLHVSDQTGVADLWLDPSNPRVLFAAMWQARRSPWLMESGGPESSLWRSLDGGDTWENISARPGLPSGMWGRMGVCSSPARSARVWALIEAEGDKRGLYRSDNRGESWEKVSSRPDLLGRPWYYSHIVADPTDADTLYAMNLGMWKSTDGGRNFEPISTPHGDNHDLWIDPSDPQRMIQGNDGGACVSYNGGASFSTIYNQPTAQFYRLDIDNGTPWRVVGTQQDNSAVSVPVFADGTGITWADCKVVGFSESGDVAVDPSDDNIILSGAVGSALGGGGPLRRFDARTGQVQLVTVWPMFTSGHDPADLRHRFGWTYPIAFSHHDADVLYTCGERVFRSLDHGASWDAISDDLTRNDPDKQVASGGPLTKDTSGAEIYCTIHAFAESLTDPDELWVGSDDGYVHVTRDAGATWSNVTPAAIPDWATIASLEPSPHDPATWYVTAHAYRFQDTTPYAFVTRDGGASWTSVAGDLPAQEHLRVLRCDPTRRGLLFAGTERGLYASLDDGQTWQRFGGDFPVVPVYDAVVRDTALVVASHGRAFWVLDDLTPLRELDDVADPVLFTPAPAMRRAPGDIVGVYLHALTAQTGRAYLQVTGGPTVDVSKRGEKFDATVLSDGGPNPDFGVTVWYHLPQESPDVTLTFLAADGTDLVTFHPRPAEPETPNPVDASNGDAPRPAVEAEAENDANETARPRPAGNTLARADHEYLPTAAGLNSFNWTLHVPGVRSLPDPAGKVIVSAGPQVPPGEYGVRLRVGESELTSTFSVRSDPRAVTLTDADLVEQYELHREVLDVLQGVIDGVHRLRRTHDQARAWAVRADTPDDLAKQAQTVVDSLEAVEKLLTNPSSLHPTHRLQQRAALDAQLGQVPAVISSADARPTRQIRDVFAELSGRATSALAELAAVLTDDVNALNDAIRDTGLPIIDTSLPPLHDPAVTD